MTEHIVQDRAKILKKPRKHDGQIKPGQYLNPTGGRKDGLPKYNPHAVWREHNERLDSLGFDPLEKLVWFATDPTVAKALQLKATVELYKFKYMAPSSALTRIECNVETGPNSPAVLHFKKYMEEVVAVNVRDY